MRKFNIGIYGSAVDEAEVVQEKARQLGKELVKYKDQVIVVTGACLGLPYEVAKVVSKAGMEVWGYSPSVNLEDQEKSFNNENVSVHSKLIYVPEDFIHADNDLVCKKYRNVMSTADCDAGIIMAGRWGSLNEFTCLTDFGKVLGVLTETGGIADELKSLTEKISKKGSGKVIFNNSPEKLLMEVINEISRQSR